MLRQLKTIGNGFRFKDDYKETLVIAINKLMAEIEVLEEEERYLESNLTRNTLEKLVNDYRFVVGEYTLTSNIPKIYDYIY